MLQSSPSTSSWSATRTTPQPKEHSPSASADNATSIAQHQLTPDGTFITALEYCSANLLRGRGLPGIASQAVRLHARNAFARPAPVRGPCKRDHPPHGRARLHDQRPYDRPDLAGHGRILVPGYGRHWRHPPVAERSTHRNPTRCRLSRASVRSIFARSLALPFRQTSGPKSRLVMPTPCALTSNA